MIKADRNNLGDSLRNYNFDVVLDVTAYTKSDVKNLLDGLNPVSQYVLISSSAVYPETLEQPFNENQKTGRNAIWKGYGTNKIETEEYLFSKIPDAYVIGHPICMVLKIICIGKLLFLIVLKQNGLFLFQKMVQ